MVFTGLLAQGMTEDLSGETLVKTEEILQEYKTLTKEDILACLMFARDALENTTFAPLSV